MSKLKFIQTLTAGVVLATAIASQVLATDEINCPSNAPNGATCWSCGGNCTAILSGDTLDITGSGPTKGYYNSSYYSSIGKYGTPSPWYGYNIKTVNIGSEITSIGARLFNGMGTLENVNFAPNSKVTSIGDSNFVDTNLKNINLPENLTSIGTTAFARTKLVNLIIPDKVNSISADIFSGTHIQTIYCSSEQLSTVCSADKLSTYSFAGSVIEYEHMDDKMVINNGNESRIYGYLDFSKEYNSVGNLIATYNQRGDLLTQYSYSPDGSISIYDANGKLIGLQGKRILTVDEATALVKNNKNTFKLKYR